MYSEERLATIARELIKNSYAPYSKFPVASIVLTKNGRMFKGVNVENSSYGLSICAERVAIFNAVSNGHRDIDVVYVFTETDEPVPPCGACRQVIAEFNPRAKIVSISLKNGRRNAWRLDELLPQTFAL